MKYNLIYFKLAIPTLVLSIALLGGIVASGTASVNITSLPQQFPVEAEESQPNTEDDLQSLSDLDEVRVQSHIYIFPLYDKYSVVLSFRNSFKCLSIIKSAMVLLIRKAFLHLSRNNSYSSGLLVTASRASHAI